MKVAIVSSKFNESVTSKLFEGCVDQLATLGVTITDADIAWVPGAIEIPLVAQRFARKGSYDAVICLGAVIRGDTSHYDYVCQSVTLGCQEVALANDIPVIFGILTTENAAQAQDRLGGAHGHKGRDAADTAVEMIQLTV
ncbi:MAG: 6,7-dimethyl-8-ribityllumazine synthase [Coxiella sp. (in: Bacteria)]|nr:MAG: 6,7-dimethyl-8-ribityllumazine synthase [Coxiella sp. (in: g-proteobacteria)]